MEKKTAMEMLIEKLEAKIEVLKIDGWEHTVNAAYVMAYRISITEAKSLLPQEREQIEEAWYDADSSSTICTNASDYFTQTYGKG